MRYLVKKKFYGRINLNDSYGKTQWLSKLDLILYFLGLVLENIIKNIFESYFTTKDKFQGTGLGLHMSFRIITESLKGTIYMENGKKDFYINLPLLNFS
ncbi:MAG: ATP-binding protein [Candidatus Altimarinota bacterium]